jgi:septal ring-binding cell division protein DamX
MAGFDPNELRAEEQQGGFEPGDTSDDSFLLEILPEYPEVMHSGKVTENLWEIADEQEEYELGNLDDDIEDTTPEDESPIEESTPEEMSNIPDDTLPDLPDLDNFSTPATGQEEEQLFEDGVAFEEEPLFEDGMSFDDLEVPEPPEFSVPPPVEATLDDETRKMIEAELASQQARNEEEDILQPPPEPPAPTPEPEPEIFEELDIEIDNEEDEEPEQRRFALTVPLLAAAMGIAGLLGVLVGMLLFDTAPIPEEDTKTMADTVYVSMKDSTTIVDSLADSMKANMDDTVMASLHDSLRMSSTANSTATMEATTDTTLLQNMSEKVQDSLSSTDSTMTDSIAGMVKGAMQDSAGSEEVAQTKTPPKQQESTKVANAKKTPTKKPVSKKVRPKRVAQKTTPTRTSRPNVKGLFMVQVYSSPSLPDAEQWLRKLQARKVANPLISSQLIQGQTWYRVRFGKFTSQDQANAAARKLGFAKSWVVRLK